MGEGFWLDWDPEDCPPGLRPWRPQDVPSHLPRVLEDTCIFNIMGNATAVRNLRVLDLWLARQSRYSEEIGDWTKRSVLVRNTGTHELASSSEMPTHISRLVHEMDDS